MGEAGRDGRACENIWRRGGGGRFQVCYCGSRYDSSAVARRGRLTPLAADMRSEGTSVEHSTRPLFRRRSQLARLL